MADPDFDDFDGTTDRQAPNAEDFPHTEDEFHAEASIHAEDEFHAEAEVHIGGGCDAFFLGGRLLGSSDSACRLLKSDTGRL